MSDQLAEQFLLAKQSGDRVELQGCRRSSGGDLDNRVGRGDGDGGDLDNRVGSGDGDGGDGVERVRMVDGGGESVFRQDSEEYCAINAVHNILNEDHQQEYLDFTKNEPGFTSLTQIAALLDKPNSRIRLLKVTKVTQEDLISWLVDKNGTDEKYAVSFITQDKVHCVSWNCNTNEIIETDPGYPTAIPITDNSLIELGITSLTGAFRLCYRKRKREKKRRRTKNKKTKQ
jgi:hypothetical protein